MSLLKTRAIFARSLNLGMLDKRLGLLLSQMVSKYSSSAFDTGV